MADTGATSVLQLIGAGGFGFLIGWYAYYVNRYRGDQVTITDLGTVIGVLGGGAVLHLFPTPGLFGAYGIGLFLGFFTYFGVLVYLVRKSKVYNSDWFLTGSTGQRPLGESKPKGD